MPTGSQSAPAAAADHHAPRAVVVVNHDSVFRPQDDRHWRVGVDRAIDATGEAAGEVEARRESRDARQIYNDTEKRCRRRRKRCRRHTSKMHRDPTHE